MTNFVILYDDGEREYFTERDAAVQRAEAVSIFKTPIILAHDPSTLITRVYDKEGNLIRLIDLKEDMI